MCCNTLNEGIPSVEVKHLQENVLLLETYKWRYVRINYKVKGAIEALLIFYRYANLEKLIRIIIKLKLYLLIGRR